MDSNEFFEMKTVLLAAGSVPSCLTREQQLQRLRARITELKSELFERLYTEIVTASDDETLVKFMERVVFSINDRVLRIARIEWRLRQRGII